MALDPAGLVWKAEHGGHVQWEESEGLGSAAAVDSSGEGVECWCVVVLEHGAHLGDASAIRVEAGAAGVCVSEAVDPAQAVPGLVARLAVGRALKEAYAGWASSQRLRASTMKLSP